MSETPDLVADTPVSRCRFYRQCGLAAGVEPEHGRIVVRADRVGAITMPARLGQEVKALMQVRRSGLGPIISHPRSRRWTYLVRPDLPDEVRLFAELFRLDVSIARGGAQIALPSPADRPPCFRVWVEPPRDTFRPSGAIVVAAIRVCARRRR
ncbi:DNA-directed RNA polymerase subunit beta [Nocardia sp. NBC_00508]|uniref:DNA-directed RNA polymerase subunit beta n=1 Tax=Nocardia sp. NBC_00508 TaxID=2975992 RepID=UPI002E810437|nr:DNA-directed RNA polymerase subunit beta [Nocardia sp. NBC_00508]WUD65463.1 DNA-directed RNA polymerase subunit beta [Nocardia sp. NBC_00508]